MRDFGRSGAANGGIGGIVEARDVIGRLRLARLNEDFEGLARTAGGMKIFRRATHYGGRIMFKY